MHAIGAMNPIVWLIVSILNLYWWIVVVQIIVSWLIHFNVINRYQPFVQQITVFLGRMTEPVYRKIRKYVPPIGGLTYHR